MLFGSAYYLPPAWSNSGAFCFSATAADYQNHGHWSNAFRLCSAKVCGLFFRIMSFVFKINNLERDKGGHSSAHLGTKTRNKLFGAPQPGPVWLWP
jgi:hypothetical protein